ncbi:hypothetical protein ACS0TY_021375 [Phlomoides rotata]
MKLIGPKNKPRTRRSFSHLLEILLLKASRKIKVSDRNIHHLSLESKKEIYKRLQISDEVKTRTKEANFSLTEIRSSISSNSLCTSEKSRSSTVGKTRARLSSRLLYNKEASRHPENQITTKTCSCKANLGLYLLVFTLFFTIFWGRATSIFFTLAFLYLFPMVAGLLR